jgi:hypothetical protein
MSSTSPSNLLMLAFCGRPTGAVLGPFGLAILYLVGAYAAVAAQYAVDPNQMAPMIGASGAISSRARRLFDAVRPQQGGRQSHPGAVAQRAVADGGFGWEINIVMGIATASMGVLSPLPPISARFIVGVALAIHCVAALPEA